MRVVEVGVFALVLVTVLAGALPGHVSAQDECDFLAPSGNMDSRNGFTTVTTAHVLCSNGMRVRSDSLRRNDSNQYYEFYGSVVLEDPERILRSERAQYFSSTGQLQAQENVRLTRKSDNGLLTGENLIFQPAQGGATEDRMVMTGGRPHAVLYTRTDTVRPEAPPPDSTSGPATPYEIDADRIQIDGQDDFDASGNVVITRDSLRAFGDRALFDREEGTLFLRGRGRLIQSGHTLEGDSVDVLLPGEVIEEVIARRRATLTDQDLDVRAPVIRILMAEGQMDRMVAIGRGAPEAPSDPLSGAEQPPATDEALLLAEHPARPVARAEGFVIVSDSIDVLLPQGVLESLTAVGSAHGESTARDSLNVESTPDIIRRDWIDGQTIVATFARVPAVDSVTGQPVEGGRSEYRLERLVSGGSARSLYRMAASDSVAAEFEGVQRPAVHYVVGDTIMLFLDRGEIQSMEVVGQVRGRHFEPVRRGGRVQPGTTGGGGPPRNEEEE